MGVAAQSVLSVLRPYVLGLDWLIALAWFFRALQWMGGLSRVPDLRQALYAPAGSGLKAKLSVIVPACNEEKGIGGCLRSLLASREVVLDIISVDDRSTDATGRIMDEVADEAAASGHAMRAIHVKELPEGWMGKTHAMGLAAAQATGEWLLFTDGDVLFDPETLARALGFAQKEEADHVILYPTLLFKGFGERMMLSFLHAMSIWGMRPWKVGDPLARRDYIGIGAFNMMRRPVYDAVGGWGALRLEVLEDLRMGFTVKRAGFRQRAVFGRDLIRIRWAEGALGVVNNMSKNLFAIFRFRLLTATAACGALLLLCLMPFVCALSWSAGWAPMALTLLALALLYARFHRLGLPNAGYALTFPIGAVLFVFALGQSIARTLGQQGVIWRGTYYPLAKLRKQAGPLR
jgi:glycosyltransferase involved in cell wall biosynthesis